MAAFDSDIEEIHAHLNQCVKDVVFEKDHIIEDVLLNPGPKDENIDNTLCEVLNVQDETCPEGEDTNDVDNVPVQQDDDNNTRSETILKTLTCISGLRNDDITTTMPAHRLVEWKKHLTSLENLTTSCFEKIQRSATSKEPNIPVYQTLRCCY